MIKKLKSNSFRTLAIILSLLMVIYLVPTTVFASIVEDLPEELEETGEITQTPTKNTAETIINNTSPYFAEEEFVREIECELIDKRQANIKHYLMNDGTYMMKVFANAVHYLDANGNWQEIGSGTLTATTLTANQESKIKITPSSSTMTLSGLNTLPNGAYILEAKLETVLQRASADTQLKLRATGAINESTATTTQITSALESSALVYEKITQNGISEFDITKVARDAYAQGNACTIAFEELDNSISTLSSASANTRLVVNYSTPIGLESYWSTVSQSAGFAGTGHVNVQTGGLTFVIDTLTTTDFLMPTGFPLVYNSTYAGQGVTSSTSAMASSVPLAGNGFKLGILETIVPYTINGVKHYIYTDSDGTQHLFKPSSGNTYLDDSGLNYTLTVNLANYLYEITDANGTYYGYHVMTDGTYRGVLVNITDTSGNTLIIDVGANQRPEQIRLRPNGMTAFVQMKLSYNSAGLISRVHLPHTNEAYIFLYSSTYNGTSLSQSNSGYLRKMIYAKGTSATTEANWNAVTSTSTPSTISKLAESTYTYDSSGKITKARDELQNIEIRYTYDSNGRISTIQEYAGESTITAGQKLGLTYNTSSTQVRSSGSDDIFNTSDDLYTHYVFDAQGRTITSYMTDLNCDTIYGSSSVSYVDTIARAKNSLSSSIETNGTYSNLIKNGGFEKYSYSTGFESWSTSGNVSYSNLEAFDTYQLMLRAQRTGGTSSIYQDVLLDDDNYTFTFSMLADYAYDTTLTFSITNTTNSTTVVSEQIIINDEYRTAWHYYTPISFSITTSGTYRITLTFTAQNSTASTQTPYLLVDNIMLSKTSSASEFSYISNGGFESNITTWTPDTGSIITTSVSSIFDKSLKLGSGTATSVTQRIFDGNSFKYSYDMYGYHNTQYGLYSLLAWAKKADTTDYGCEFRIKVDLTYHTQNASVDTVKSFEYSFSQDHDIWQHGAITFTVNPELGLLVAIDVTLEFNTTSGTAYFDEIVLIKDSASACAYTYNTSGRITYTKQGLDEVWTYYSNSNPVVMVDSDENIVFNTYDSARRVTASVSYKYDGEYHHNYASDYHAILGSTLKVISYTTYNYLNTGLLAERRVYGSDGIAHKGVKFGDAVIIKLITNGVINEPELFNSGVYSGAKYFSYKTSYRGSETPHIFGAVAVEYDSLNRETTYYYDLNTGNLNAILYPDLNGISYSYDNLGNLIDVSPATYANSGYTSISGPSVEYEYTDTNRLSKIITDTTTYTLAYDTYGNPLNASAGSNTLASYTYNSGNGKLSTLTYANGAKVKYVYDNLDRIKEVQYNGGSGSSFTTAYEYLYDTNGNIVSLIDRVNNQVIQPKYDSFGRLLSSVTIENDEVISNSKVDYDEKSRIKSHYFSFSNADTGAYSSGVQTYRGFSYNEVGNIYYVSDSHGSYSHNAYYSFDNFGRKCEENHSVYVNYSNTFNIKSTYGYTSQGNQQSSLVSSYLISITPDDSTAPTYFNEFTYSYNTRGYIESSTNSNTTNYTYYFYDKYGRLIQENNAFHQKTYVWEYDDAGNITHKYIYPYTPYGNLNNAGALEGSISYTYAANSDKLISYNGQSITYDASGNPLSYRGATLTWRNGRELATYTTNTPVLRTYTYTYNSSGIRIEKSYTDNLGTAHTTKYILDGSVVMRQSWEGFVCDYIYGENGKPVAFGISRNGGAYEYYFYETNLLGDIVAVYNSSGNAIVHYSYDAWGNFIEHNVSNALTTYPELRQAILFRYRGYIYDLESGLYYLQSRYYDSQTGRFINADGVSLLSLNPSGFTDKNLYAYCDNNPIMRTDDGGTAWETVFDLVSLGFSIADVVMNPEDPWAWAGLVGDTLDLIPILTGVGESVRAINTARKISDAADDVYDAAKAVDRVDNIVGTTRTISRIENTTDGIKTAKKIHGNSLQCDKINYGYQLLDGNNNILKYGETIHPKTRYSSKWLETNNYRMEIKVVGTKSVVHEWQHEMILNYTYIAGHRPPMNKSFW